MTSLRKFIFFCCFAFAFFASTALSYAGDYPSRLIRVVVPWPAGGGNDVLGRLIGQQMEKSLGQQVIVENKPGASGIIGAREVVKAKPDGYTLLLTSNSLTLNAALRPERQQIDVLKDLEPIAVAATVAGIIVVNPSVPAHSVKELVALAKAKPGTLTAGTSGVGSPAYFLLKDFESRTGIDVVEVPYKGAPPLMNALLGGRIDFSIANPAVALPQIKAGKVRALAVASARRSPTLPDLPTVEEAGIPGFVDNHWMGYFAPRGTPAAIIDRLIMAIHDAVAVSQVAASLQKTGIAVDRSSNPASFTKLLKQDLEQYQRLIKAAHITAD
ncbi:MAG TPA: tripartite tricarboxylate transporter substrate-binding protein [Burkholderiales bacterium]|nr:tripartite tricarboxylate transporter substrate-binding protein [Burkholderiales bacterium]